MDGDRISLVFKHKPLISNQCKFLCIKLLAISASLSSQPCVFSFWVENSGQSFRLWDAKSILSSWGNFCWFTDLLLFLSSEIQLKSPNWLFGQRKYEEGSSAAKVASREIDIEGSHDFCNLNWLSSDNDMNEEDVFQRYVSKMYIILATLQCIFYISLHVWCPICPFSIGLLWLPVPLCMVIYCILIRELLKELS